jgi:LPPG:FO 2-phospho-L-lactate transferase
MGGHPVRSSRRPAGADPRGDGAPRIVVVAGGVGAARFLAGLVRVVPPDSVTVVVNTADDVEVHGLHVSPDIDSVIYRLAGLADDERGWGLEGETWRALEALGRLGAETWFQLGDADLATHIWRTARLRRGVPLSSVTAAQCAALGVGARVVPMTDDRVTTRVHCPELGEVHLQEWFVRERCGPAVDAVRFEGVERARPAPGVLEAIAAADALVIAPSNPIISVGPVLAVPGLRAALREVPRGVAVTPIVGGRAVKGPAAELLRAEGIEVSPAGVAALYADCVQAMVVDERDLDTVPAVEALGLQAIVTDTLMTDVDAAARLARAALGAVGLEPVGAAA